MFSLDAERSAELPTDIPSPALSTEGREPEVMELGVRCDLIWCGLCRNAMYVARTEVRATRGR